jgi:hypothetical protein
MGAGRPVRCPVPFALWPPPIPALLRRAPPCAYFEPISCIYR